MKKNLIFLIAAIALISLLPVSSVLSQDMAEYGSVRSLYEIPPRNLIDMPTAGTFPRGHFDIGVRLYPEGGAIGFTDIGLSNRLTLGISFGGEEILSSNNPSWNDQIEFNIKFRVIDELEYFPAVSVGYASQGFGAWLKDVKRYTYKSRGFYGVVSRSFYFYQWTASWHGGINYSQESNVDKDEDINFFAGFDATFRYNLAFLMEYDAALNDNKSKLPNGDHYEAAGKGRGYLNMSLKWLFTENLELEAILKDLLVNHRVATFTREIRITYIDSF